MEEVATGREPVARRLSVEQAAARKRSARPGFAGCGSARTSRRRYSAAATASASSAGVSAHSAPSQLSP
jgi:hypothetical protein